MLKDFQEHNPIEKEEMIKNLSSEKLEEVRSTWYFVTAPGKFVAGSKG